MVCPVGPRGTVQEFVQLDKDLDGKVSHKKIMDVVYVPLTDKNKQV